MMRNFQIGLGFCFLVSCQGATPAVPVPSHSGDVTCPAGQKFDGAYCVLDPNAPTKAEPLAPQGTAPATSSSAQTSPAPSGSAAPSPSAAPVSSAVPVSSAAPASNAAPEKARATPIDVSMAIGLAPVIQYLAGAHLTQGAKPLGAPFAGQFKEGQELEQRVKLTPGKCYTVVAASLPPLTSLAVSITSVSDDVVLKKETEGGTQVALGRKKECLVVTEPQSDVRITVLAEKGSGVAGAQVFEK